MKLYLDLDVIAYRSAASCEPTKAKPFREPLEDAINRADELMFRIFAETDTDDYVGYLSGGENFRYQLYPQYKANRTQRKPEWLEPVREFLIQNWKARVVTEYETDDAIGIAYNSGIIVSNDKDFLQIPGTHYDFTKSVLRDVGEEEAQVHFWKSMVLGDRADNITGIPGYGEVYSLQFVNKYPVGELEFAVRELYEQYNRDFELNFDLLHILRSEKDWENIENKLSKSKGPRTPATSSQGDSSSIPGANGT